MQSIRSSCDEIAALIEKSSHLLPAQGPIDVFVHHNTLHAFESEPFEEAVIHAAGLFDTEPFLPESRYREELARGRIQKADIDAVLDSLAPAPLSVPLAGGRATVRDLHRILLLHAVRPETDAEVRWTLSESDVLERFRDDLPEVTRERLLAGSDGLGPRAHERQVCSDLWHACVEAMALSRPTLVHIRPPVRHRDLIRSINPTIDTDELVHPLLIRLSAAFLDQGVAAWPMPGREQGFLAAVISLYSNRFGPLPPWAAKLPQALAERHDLAAEAWIAEEMTRCGVNDSQREEFLQESLLALRG